MEQEQAKLEQAKQEKARLEQARLEQVKQEKARLEQAKLEKARQEQARLEQARLEQARLREEEERKLKKFDVSLGRASTKKDWGFKWNMAALAKDQLEVVDVNRGTPLESWNREQFGLQRVDLVVRKGDRLMSVQGHTTRKEMQQSLKTESEVALIFAHTPASEEAEAPPEEAGHCKGQTHADQALHEEGTANGIPRFL